MPQNENIVQRASIAKDETVGQNDNDFFLKKGNKKNQYRLLFADDLEVSGRRSGKSSAICYKNGHLQAARFLCHVQSLRVDIFTLKIRLTLP